MREPKAATDQPTRLEDALFTLLELAREYDRIEDRDARLKQLLELDRVIATARQTISQLYNSRDAQPKRARPPTDPLFS